MLHIHTASGWSTPALYGARKARRPAALLALVGVTAGTLLALVAQAGLVVGPSTGHRSAILSNIPSVIAAAALAAVFAAGWTTLALWDLSTRRPALGTIWSAVLAALTIFIPAWVLTAAPDLNQVALWMIGAVEAVAAGMWLADLFGCLTRSGITAGLAATLWLILGVLLLAHAGLYAVLPIILALILACPLVAVAFSSHQLSTRLSRLWLAAVLSVLPLALLLSWFVTTTLL
jgi:hypothetical protein